jgi:DNA-binding transcriptional MerR regulator
MKTLKDKLFYTIGEAAKIVGVQQHVLRNWEKEFKFVKPIKKDTGHRLYTKKEIEIFLRIKELLYTEMYTIAGARKRLWYELKRNELPSQLTIIKRIKNELQELYEILLKIKK